MTQCPFNSGPTPYLLIKFQHYESTAFSWSLNGKKKKMRLTKQRRQNRSDLFASGLLCRVLMPNKSTKVWLQRVFTSQPWSSFARQGHVGQSKCLKSAQRARVACSVQRGADKLTSTGHVFFLIGAIRSLLIPGCNHYINLHRGHHGNLEFLRYESSALWSGRVHFHRI